MPIGQITRILLNNCCTPTVNVDSMRTFRAVEEAGLMSMEVVIILKTRAFIGVQRASEISVGATGSETALYSVRYTQLETYIPAVVSNSNTALHRTVLEG